MEDHMSDPILCYAEDNWAYFTHRSLEVVWGDDWDDAPWRLNAGPPYDEYVACIIGFRGDLDHPWEHAERSVEAINKYKLPWLQSYDLDQDFLPGMTLSDFKDGVRRCGGTIYEETT